MADLDHRARPIDLLLTALAPAVWGSTYVVTTQLLPPDRPLTVSLLRALPAGLLLLLIVRRLPFGVWWGRMFVLGALNFSVFWWLLFVSAYRLPGGVAATVGAIQPLIVMGLEKLLFRSRIHRLSVALGVAGIGGVALLVLGPRAALDPIGVAAGLAGAVAMAAGTVMTRYWQPPVSTLTATAWQLTAGGILLVPAAFIFEPALPPLSTANWIGLIYMGTISAALTYILWFRGIARLRPSIVAPLGFLSPLIAVILGWWLLDQTLTPIQFAGAAVVIGCVWINQRLATVRPKAAG